MRLFTIRLTNWNRRVNPVYSCYAKNEADAISLALSHNPHCTIVEVFCES